MVSVLIRLTEHAISRLPDPLIPFKGLASCIGGKVLGR